MEEVINLLLIEFLKQPLFLFFVLIGLGYVLFCITKNIKYVLTFVLVIGLGLSFSKIKNFAEFLGGFVLLLIIFIGLIIIIYYKINEKSEKKSNIFADIEKELDTNLEKKVNNQLDLNKNNVSMILEMRKELVEYRKVKSKEKNIPAYYIFNNKELDKIIELMPKTLNELRRSGILSEVKCKLYGDEIINIMNNLRF